MVKQTGRGLVVSRSGVLVSLISALSKTGHFLSKVESVGVRSFSPSSKFCSPGDYFAKLSKLHVIQFEQVKFALSGSKTVNSCLRVLSATLILSKNSRVLDAKSRPKSANLG